LLIINDLSALFFEKFGFILVVTFQLGI